MYVVTFYSFKGGVGRTLGLVNVGCELARRGKTVLLVDFDLEAPGISTFPKLEPKRPTQGIVQYVTRYLAENVAPEVRDYVYPVEGIAEHGGALWVMPAGQNDEGYSRTLRSIDWETLYRDRGGSLLIDDLRNQWEESIAPDYVLIDSRTGYTDVSGICTRQLPDAVVVLFFPNEQNLVGLRKVVGDIRAEATAPRSTQIDLSFVVSNVPDLDDEDLILERRMKEFSKALGYVHVAAHIHRYDSLALLNQAIFTVDRPCSRLAREYHALTDAIVKRNVEDPLVASDRLVDILRRGYNPDTMPASAQKTIEEIAELHSQDPEILYLLSMTQSISGKVEDAIKLINQAIVLGNRKPQVLLSRADLLLRAGDKSGAIADVRESLETSEADPQAVRRAIGVLRRLAPEMDSEVIKSRSFQSLAMKDRYDLHDELLWTKQGAAAAAEVLQVLLEMGEHSPVPISQIKKALALCLIGAGDCERAAEVGAEVLEKEPDVIDVLFNLAMAEWGRTGKPDKLRFEAALAASASIPAVQKEFPNYHQCMALTLAVLGKTKETLAELQLAREKLLASAYSSFSCWRYLYAKADRFRQDCDAIATYATGNGPEPIFVSEARTHESLRK